MSFINCFKFFLIIGQIVPQQIFTHRPPEQNRMLHGELEAPPGIH